MTTEQIWNKQLEQRFYELHPHTLLRFEVHVAEHCNLSCRDCLHFSPLAKEEFLDIDEYRKDCARLSELFDSEVERLYLLGGEPLLHPNLVEIMKISREAFGRHLNHRFMAGKGGPLSKEGKGPGEDRNRIRR